MELEDSFAPFLFIMDKDLCVKYLQIHNKPLPRLTLIYLEEIKKCGRSYCGWSYDIKPQAVNEDGKEDLIIVGSFEEAEGMIEERIVLELEDVPAYLWLPDRITLESRKKWVLYNFNLFDI